MSRQDAVDVRVRRARGIRVAVGIGMIVVVAALVLAQVVTGWHLRELRVLAFAGLMVIVLLTAFVAVTVTNGRRVSPDEGGADSIRRSSSRTRPRLDA
ncbi:hypothetical protein ABC195_04435 [Microbacterium sp. 2P01SA-2]|uniref:hypothetical protein n=1 Tax=unclassified Microbacterium TaxID=2609290 RepID=UPI0039A03860